MINYDHECNGSCCEIPKWKPRWRYNHYLMWWERVGYPSDICIVMRNGWLAKIRQPM
jgi:hypothetical protein